MTQSAPLAELALAAYEQGPNRLPTSLDVLRTILSQYANSPIILAILTNFAEGVGQQADFERFYSLVWNVESAEGYGLDVWGRIVGVQRVLHIPIGGYLGFDQATDAETFGEGIWYGHGTSTQNYALADSAFRTLILAKAALNITDGSIASTNSILMALFPGYGNCYVRDNLDMSITYVFGATLSPVDSAIVFQSGVLPRGAGVSFTVEQS